jgi:integrase/recombinase XerD
MKKEKVGVKVVPDIRRIKDEERFPLKLRINYKGKRSYYGVGYDATKEEWKIINSAEAKRSLRKIKNIILTIENDAQACCEKINPFSFKYFENDFFYQRSMFETLQSTYDAYVRELKNNNQYGTAIGYQTALNTFSKFKPNLDFDDITKEFLQKFELWMLEKGKSLTTISMYVRTLRAIMNLAKNNGIKILNYPFGRRKYLIPASRNIKKALNIDQIKQVFNYSTIPESGLDKAKDFWIFSYLCNGINMGDIVRRCWNNLNAETIVFEREKTKRTKRDSPVKIIAIRNDRINAIIEKWGKKNPGNSNSLVFNVIEEYDDAERTRKKIQQFIHLTNNRMKKLGEDLGFDLKLTIYVARHSFATILVRSGAPLALASQTLEHSNILTTQKYFAGFDLKDQAEYTKALTAF